MATASTIKVKDVVVTYYDENSKERKITLNEFENFVLRDEVVFTGLDEGWDTYMATGFKIIECKGKIK